MNTSSHRFLRSLTKSAAVVLVFLLTATGAYLGLIQYTGNFAPVIPGELYRSAQLDGTALESYVKAHGIRSVINLRGENIGKPWYEDEVATAKRLGIAHFDFAMTARRELTQSRSAELISLMAKAPKPLLIHCKAGADRSGLASALYLAAIAKKGEAAEGQISIYYGHISLPLSAAYAMDRTFEALEPWLGFPDS